jgi:TIR domain
MATASSYVFVSYSHKDAAVVGALVQALENRDIFFRFDRDLAAGEAVQERLRQLLNDAGVVLVVWSRHSASSAAVIDEAGRARARDRLVPVSLTGMPDVPRPFQDLYTLDLSAWSGDPSNPRVDQLGRALQDRLASQPDATSKPKPWYRRMPAWVGPAFVAPLIVGVILSFVTGWAGRITGGSSPAVSQQPVPSRSASPHAPSPSPSPTSSSLSPSPSASPSGTITGPGAGSRSASYVLPLGQGSNFSYFSFDLGKQVGSGAGAQMEASYFLNEIAGPLFSIYVHYGVVQSEVGKQACYYAADGRTEGGTLPSLYKGLRFCVLTSSGVALMEIMQTPGNSGPLDLRETYWPGASP